MPFQGFPVIMTTGLKAAAVAPAWTKGFDFRATSGFVTDDANYTYVLPADTYPTTRNSVTFGWVVDGNTVSGADRNSGAIPQLAGINFVAGLQGASPTYFRVDLPSAGTFDVTLGLGDASFAQVNMRVEVRDTSTSKFFVLTGGDFSTSANHFVDASGVDRTAAAWPTDEVAVSTVFATTQLWLIPGSLSASDVTTMACLVVTQTA